MWDNSFPTQNSYLRKKHEKSQPLLPQCVNLMIFFIIQILREINFEYFRIAKCAILTHLEALNFDFYFLSILALFEGWNLPQKPKFRAQKIAKTTVLASPKLISRKIWMTEKSWNFYTVFPQLHLLSSLKSRNNKHFAATTLLKRGIVLLRVSFFIFTNRKYLYLIFYMYKMWMSNSTLWR